MRAAGLDVPIHVNRPLGHGLLGQVHLVDWLIRRHAADPLRAQHLGGIVGGHHGSNPSDQDFIDARNAFVEESNGWAKVRDEILDGFAIKTGADAWLGCWLAGPIPSRSRF